MAATDPLSGNRYFKKRWKIQGVLKGEQINAHCDALDREHAKFIFSHSSDAIGVVFDWETLEPAQLKHVKVRQP